MMTDLEFCHAVRNRLSLLPDDRLGDECTDCGKNMSPLHPHICKKLRKLVTGARHDMVTGCVLKRAREAGMTASNEPYLGPGPNPLRADGALFGLLTFLYFDTSVINPSTTTSIEKFKSHTKGLLAAAGREAVKLKKYKNHLPAGASFVPFVLESFGSLGTGAFKVIQSIVAEFGERYGDNLKSEFRKFCFDSVSIALQKGTSRMFSLFSHSNLCRV